MRHLDMQDRIERAVYSTIDDIADEFGVEIKKYPEVNWIGGRKKDIEKLGLSMKSLNYLIVLKKLKSSCTFGRKPIIFIVDNCYLDIAEESAHYVHFLVSGICWKKRSVKEQKSLRIISEAFAFLGTKFVIPGRRNVFSKYPDMFYMIPEEKKKVLAEIAKKEKPSRVPEYFIYQQGYGLGERIFYDLFKGGTSRKEIKDYITSNFGRGYDANVAFAKLKLRYWPPPSGDINYLKELSKKEGILNS